ncbi:PDZ domain-containing protein [Aporhodopirellula aestuarii]|uniref:PDZ domain-containing protein n=1 Tax=Aporhodopirellula aestuarii TaxID=2950107 RepID=A0ABT0U423_9BACT|nr:PDZ domain-containing protein [Aporhodopirellula aestuarii]MCM2371183.1 PDZ domain-containing protein [Aporhodopirellula aestuarii]
MFVSVSSKKSRSVVLTFVGVVLLVVVQGAFCQPASAQRLMERLRARIEARRVPQPPAEQPQTPASSEGNRVLATPVPRQGNGKQNAADAKSSADAKRDQDAAPTFGIEVSPVAAGTYRGLQVLGFTPDSKAPSVGIRPGDVIVSIDGIRTDSVEAVAAAQRRVEAGAQAVVHILRNGRLYQTKLATIAGPVSVLTDDLAGDTERRPDDSSSGEARSAAKPPLDRSKQGPTLAQPRASLGVEARDASPLRGVLVAIVNAGMAGEIAGLKPNDRIVSVSGRLIRDTNGLLREIALLNPGDSVTLGVVRGDSIREIEVEMGGPGGVPARAATGPVDESAGGSVLERAETVAPSQPASETDPKPATGESLLGGLGSTLGSLFSGGQSGANEDAKGKETSGAKPGESELPPPQQNDETDASPLDPLALPEDGFGIDILPPPVEN